MNIESTTMIPEKVNNINQKIKDLSIALSEEDNISQQKKEPFYINQEIEPFKEDIIFDKANEEESVNKRLIRLEKEIINLKYENSKLKKENILLNQKLSEIQQENKGNQYSAVLFEKSLLRKNNAFFTPDH